MNARHPEPKTQGDDSPRMLEKLAKLPDHQMWAVVDGGPDSSISGHFYTECYWEAFRRMRAAIDSQEL